MSVSKTPKVQVIGLKGDKGDRGESGLVPSAALHWQSELTIPVNTSCEIDTLQDDITITLGAPITGFDNEWIFTITQGETAYQVNLPVLQWAFGMAPTFAANTTTEVRIHRVGGTFQSGYLLGAWFL